MRMSSNYDVSDLAILWEAQAVFDLTVFVLTILKTLQTRRECMIENVCGKGPQLTGVIFRDGASYFAAMVVCNVANILTFYLAEPVLKGFLSTLATCISVTLMSRLMLNLYEASTHVDDIIVYELASVSHPAPAGESKWLVYGGVITECVVGMDDIRDMRGAAEWSSSAI
ncbi:hypothetical protein EWM64_g6850 [Hericium alpestre]|uniref:Uncharacterized protein n=1 Tax=Hericium alpestre TaxID=135208 RepID=A0A4Y9ZQI8_9AGAM|nr:hypothetical protein EWM64_g6850 [Hericium alpestre]